MDKTSDSRTSEQPSAIKKILKSVRRSAFVERLVQYRIYYRWLLKGRPAGPTPHLKKQYRLRDFQTKYQLKTLVETGTYLGIMVEAMKGHFERIYSIEFAQDLYERAKKQFAAQPNVTLLQGDSAVCLKELVPQLTSPALFWLDAHYSGGITGMADLETPVVEEIQAILSSPQRHILIIDDSRCFDGTHDYPTIKAITDQITTLKPDYRVYVEDDAIIAEPKA